MSNRNAIELISGIKIELGAKYENKIIHQGFRQTQQYSVGGRDLVAKRLDCPGLLGKKLEAVVVDPASNWPLFAEKTKELLEKDKVDVIFGCWTSVSRKSVLPVIEELNGLLFYPVQYEGEESSKNVFYTGAAPNQQAIPAVDYLMSSAGGSQNS